MTVTTSAVLGLAFLALSVLATFTMYQFWSYPYDKERRKSECPQWKMNIHRLIGLAYVAVYVLLMIEMVPRLWTYQVEFPARTVAHISIGISIGVLLLVKISILRWFRHFEEWMPALGTLLMVLTFVLVGLSVPFVLKERALASGALGEGAFGEENRARVAQLLPEAGFSDEVDLDELATERGLRAGRRVLLNQCVECHDLKTAIESPRTPQAWRRTVERMAEKPTLGTPITEPEQREVTAYLIAITPELQRSEVARRDASAARERTRESARDLFGLPAPDRDDLRGDEWDEGPEDGAAPDEDGAAPDEDGAAPDEDGAAPDEDHDDASAAEGTEQVRGPREEPEDGSDPRDNGAGEADPEGDAPRDDEPEEEGPREDEGADGAEEAADGGDPDGEPGDDARAAEAAAVFEAKCSLCHDAADIHNEPPASRGEARDLIFRMVDHGLEASDRELRLIEDHLVREFAE